MRNTTLLTVLTCSLILTLSTSAIADNYIDTSSERFVQAFDEDINSGTVVIITGRMLDVRHLVDVREVTVRYNMSVTIKHWTSNMIEEITVNKPFLKFNMSDMCDGVYIIQVTTPNGMDTHIVTLE